MGPDRTMLVGNVEIRVGNMFRQKQSILATKALFELCEPVLPKHFAQRIWCIYRSINDNMRNVDTLRRKLGIERLAQHSPPAHRCGMRVLASIAAHSRSR